MFNLWNDALEQNPGPHVDVLGLVLEAVVNPHWQGPAAAVQEEVEATFVDDGEGEDSDGDDHDSGEHTESGSDSESSPGTPSQQEFQSVFASRYNHWPDFDAPDSDSTTTCNIIEDEGDRE